jgi:LPS O-antigen subunit length determinant protein (WzzB/FepE family)
LNEKLKLTNTQLLDIVEKINYLENSRKKAISSSRTDAMSVLLYSNEIQNQQIYLNDLQEKFKNFETEVLGADVRIDNLRLKLTQLKGTNLVKPPTIPESPVKPNKKVIVALAFILA